MLRTLGFAALLAWLSLAHAQLAIEITGAGAQRIPIAIVPLAGEKALPPGLTSLVRADLERSGLFPFKLTAQQRNGVIEALGDASKAELLQALLGDLKKHFVRLRRRRGFEPALELIRG